MGNLHLVTGHAGTAHVTAADRGSFNAAIFGEENYVLNRGSKFATTVISNNSIRVADGDIVMQGRHIRLNEGTYVNLTIENGSQGMARNDLIVARYTKDSITGIEDCNLVVIKGNASTGSATDPEYTSGDIINDHVLIADMPLYRISIVGLNIESVVPLFVLRLDFHESIKEAQSAAESHIANKSNPHGVTAAQSGAVPISRTVNGKKLSSNISLNASDVGALSMELLWENASPSSEFAAGDVRFDTSSGELFALEHTGANANSTVVTIVSKANSRLSFKGYPSGKEYRRNFTFEDYGFNFADAYLWTSSSSETKTNSALVPLKIYVIKGVST